MPTTRVYARQVHQSLGTALPDIVRFLIDDHPTITGPGWTIVEAQSGANREVPSVATDLDSLVSATGWPNGTVAANDWIVLESADANNSNHFQLYIEMQSTTIINFMMIPLEDFSTGGGAASPPTFPSTAFAEGASLFQMTTLITSVIYNVIADEGMFALIVDDTGTTSGVDWTYIGEISPAFPASDSRCYIVWDTESELALADSAGDVSMNRLSPLDNTTVLTSGFSSELFAWGPNVRIHEDSVSLGKIIGAQTIFPIGVYFGDTGHQHFAGYMRNVFSIHAYSGARGMMNNRNLMYRSNNIAAPGLLFPWDGSTDY